MQRSLTDEDLNKYYLHLIDQISCCRKEFDAHVKKFSNLIYSVDFDFEKNSNEIAELESEMCRILILIEELNNKFI